MSAIDLLLERHASRASDAEADALSAVPSTGVAIVTCMDTRIDVYATLGVAPGEVHVLRNAGGLTGDDTLRSLAISQSLLGTREVMLIQHTDCGMSKLSDEAIADAVESSSGTRLPCRAGAFDDLEESIRRSLETLRRCEYLPHRDGIRGFVLDVGTGRLREID